MKTIVITGASSGIGKATARLFSENGWNVAATMRNLEKAEEFKEYKNTNCFFMDVTDVQSVEKCVGQIIQEFGSIDVLINNAGVYETNPLEETSFEKIDQLIQTNIYGTVNITKIVLQHFRQNQSGLIVNISSIAGRATFPFQSIYQLTKWAVEGFSESLRYELKNQNICVKTIEPGCIKTNLWRSLGNRSFENYPSVYKTNFNNWLKYLNNNIQKGNLPDFEARAIYKAVTDKKYRLHYSSDFNTKLAVFLHTFLSVNAFQSFISKQVKMDKIKHE
jgi:NADP-dependent 3-hydroxy acid dehydrogenase YdfG